MDKLIILCLIISFASSLFISRWWISRAKKAGLVAKDMHKKDSSVAEMGGICVFFGFVLGLLFYLGHRTFFQNTILFNLEILAVLLSVSLIAFLGLIDDLLGWKIGLRQWQKPILVMFSALPIMMINSGESLIGIPFVIDLGLVYPLLLIPVAISGAANGFNMLAGYNGLEAGLGAIILFTQGMIIWLVKGQGEIAMIAFTMVFALLGFLYYNKYPARIFPGNILTYSVGGLIAIMAIIGNMEIVSLVLFVPYFIEFFLKSFGGWQKESFAKLEEKGGLSLFDGRVYGLEHLMILFLGKFKKKVFEQNVVWGLYCFQMIFVVVAVVIL